MAAYEAKDALHLDAQGSAFSMMSRISFSNQIERSVHVDLKPKSINNRHTLFLKILHTQRILLKRCDPSFGPRGVEYPGHDRGS